MHRKQASLRRTRLGVRCVVDEKNVVDEKAALASTLDAESMDAAFAGREGARVARPEIIDVHVG